MNVAAPESMSTLKELMLVKSEADRLVLGGESSKFGGF